MKVELPGESKSFADINAGECFAFTRKQVTSVCMKVEWLSSASIAVLWSASDDWTVPHLIAPTELAGSVLHSLPSAVFIASSDAKDVRTDRTRHEYAPGFLIKLRSLSFRMASVIAETRLQATDDFRFEAPPGNGRFLSQPTMKLLRQPQTDHPMSRPPLHQGKASNASPKGNPDNQAGNGGKGDGHGDTTGQTWNANLLARFNDGPLMNGEMCLEPLSALGRINGRQAVTGRSPAFADQQTGFDLRAASARSDTLLIMCRAECT